MTMHLANTISYFANEEETQDGILVRSHNCNVDTSLQRMVATKQKYGKISLPCTVKWDEYGSQTLGKKIKRGEHVMLKF